MKKVRDMLAETCTLQGNHPRHVARYRVLLTPLLAASLILSGCTSFGYYPENLSAKQIVKGGGTDNIVPKYSTVKKWAYDVQDGLDTRATINHYALEYGAILALAAAGAMAGLAIFAPGSDALKGIPLGLAFLGGVAAYYDNHYKFDMYSRASDRVRELIDESDKRYKLQGAGEESEAACLKLEVGRIIATIKKYLIMSEPDTLVAQLGTVKTDGSGKALTPQDQTKLMELLKASRHDLSDLDPRSPLYETYCRDAEINPLLIKNPMASIDADRLVVLSNSVLIDFSERARDLETELKAGNEVLTQVKAKIAEIQTKKGADATKELKGRLGDLENLIKAETANSWNSVKDSEVQAVARLVPKIKTDAVATINLRQELTKLVNLTRQISTGRDNISTLRKGLIDSAKKASE
jgi:hypothetical protein